MPEAPPDPTLQTTALRYAAGDLTPAEAASFEARLGDDQHARDALSEAVRLSAAALGQEPPAPDRSFRAAIRERLIGWCPDWLARRAYRGHPLVWASAGAVAVAACAIAGLSLADREPNPPAVPAPVVAAPAVHPAPVAIAPEPREAESFTAAATAPDGTECHSVAEIWAQLSTPEHVEKAHDDEMRWRHKFHNGAFTPVGRADVPREP